MFDIYSKFYNFSILSEPLLIILFCLVVLHILLTGLSPFFGGHDNIIRKVLVDFFLVVAIGIVFPVISYFSNSGLISIYGLMQTAIISIAIKYAQNVLRTYYQMGGFVPEKLMTFIAERQYYIEHPEEVDNELIGFKYESEEEIEEENDFEDD